MKRTFNKNCTRVITRNWKVELVDLGEGIFGDYNPDDPDDKPLFRFDFYSRPTTKSPWSVPNDSSYCTDLNANINKKTRQKALRYLISAVEFLPWDENIKKLCERLSWINEDLLDNRHKK